MQNYVKVVHLLGVGILSAKLFYQYFRNPCDVMLRIHLDGGFRWQNSKRHIFVAVWGVGHGVISYIRASVQGCITRDTCGRLGSVAENVRWPWAPVEREILG